MASFVVVWGLIVLTWLLLAAGYAGLGMLSLRCVHVRCTPQRLPAFVWLGYCFCLLVLQIWHLFLPVDNAFTILFVAGAGCGWLSIRSQWRELFHSLFQRPTWGWMLCALLVTIWAANRAMGPNHEIDSHLYHLPTMQWLKQFRIVPGLGNLYLPLASNSSSLLIAAWLDGGPWEHRAFHVVNGFLISALFWHGFSGTALLFRKETSERAVGLFRLLAVIPAAQMSNHWMISGFSTDVAPAALVLAAACELFALLVQSTEPASADDPDAYDPRFSAFQVAVLLSGAVCCKLTALAFTAVALLLAVGALLRWGRKLGRQMLPTLAYGAAVSALLLATWMGRGVLLSGYPLYPSTSPAVDVDWRIPSSLVEQEKFYQMLRNRLRQYYDWGIEDAIQSLAGWGWMRYWVRLQERDSIVPACLFVAGVVAAVLWRRSYRGRDGRALWRGWLLLVPTCPAMAFWFLTQATMRMGFFLIWVLGSTAVALAAASFLSRASTVRIRAVVVVMVLAAGLNLKKTHTPPGEDYGLHVGMVAPPMQPFQTAWGLTIWHPADGGRLCSDAPLPATPTPRKQLQLRRPDDLAAGFRFEQPSLASPNAAPQVATAPSLTTR